MLIGRSHFDSRHTESYRLLGGYKYPVLEVMLARGTISWYTVSSFSIAENEIDFLFAAVDNPRLPFRVDGVQYEESDTNSRVFLAYVKNHLTVIRADGRFSDTGLVLASDGVKYRASHVKTSIEEIKTMEGSLGMHELTNRAHSDVLGIKHPQSRYPSEDVVDLFTQGADELGAKLEKRAGTIGRAFRFWTPRTEFAGRVVPGTVLNDGYALVSEDVIEECIAQYDLVGFRPGARARIINWLDSQPVFNSRFLGVLINVDSGEPIEGHLKVQMAKDKLPKGVDFVVPDNGIKAELHGVNCDWAVAGFEPQGVKPLYEDQQTVSNQRFTLAIPDVRARIKDEGRKAFDRLTTGSLVKNLTEVVSDEFDRKLTTDGDAFNRMLRWVTSAVVSYSVRDGLPGLSVFDSPWLMEKLGEQWVSSLAWSKALDKRVDDMTNQDKRLVAMWKQTLRIIVPCGKRIQIISESAANMHSKVNIKVNRGDLRPVNFHKGRVTAHVMVCNDYDYEHILVPSSGGSDGDDFYACRWVTIEDAKKIVSTRNPNVRGEYCVWNYVEGDWAPTHKLADGTEVRFPKITKKRWPTQILDALDSGEMTYKVLPTKNPEWHASGEDDRDATIADDRAAVNAEVAEMITFIKASGTPVDRVIGSRLGDKEILLTDDAFISNAKKAMDGEIRQYLERVKRYVRTLKVPKYLAELGSNQLYNLAVQKLKESRRAMWQASQAHMDVTEAQDAVLTTWVMSQSEGYDRARAVMALWYACWTTPTSPRSGSRITDQPVFGTGVFHHVDAEERHHWPFLDALMYFGVAREPELSDLREYPVKYVGNFGWDVKCIVDDEEFFNLKIHQLVTYYDNNQVCRNHRQA